MHYAYTILYVADVTATVRFYEQAFGLARRFVDEHGQYAELETGATTLAFASEALVATSGVDFQPNRRATRPAGAEIGLMSEDVARDFSRAVAAGALPVQPPTQKPWGQTVSHVRDADGFLVEICSAVGT